MQTEAQARAKRLHFVRGLSGLSRDQLTHRYGVAKSTLQNWESGRNRLTERGAVALLRAYRAEEIEISMDWLLYGIGTGPRQRPKGADALAALKLPDSLLPMRKQIIAELSALRKLYPDLVDCPITNAAMQPQYPNGCYVAGIKRYQAEIDHLIGQDCLVYALETGLILRRVMPGDSSGHFHLAPLNLLPEFPIITNCQPAFAAPVIWVQAPAFRLA